MGKSFMGKDKFEYRGRTEAITTPFDAFKFNGFDREIPFPTYPNSIRIPSIAFKVKIHKTKIDQTLNVSPIVKYKGSINIQ